MNAQETIAAGKLMVEFGEEWERSGKPPKWLNAKAKPPLIINELTSISHPGWDWSNWIYCCNPEPKLVPFTANDITPGMQFRCKGSVEWWCATSAHEKGVAKDGVYAGYDKLLEHCECREYGELAWKPCGKVVES